MKKFILGLGGIAAMTAPVAAVISCGNNNSGTTKKEEEKKVAEANKASVEAVKALLANVSVSGTTKLKENTLALSLSEASLKTIGDIKGTFPTDTQGVAMVFTNEAIAVGATGVLKVELSKGDFTDTMEISVRIHAAEVAQKISDANTAIDNKVSGIAKDNSQHSAKVYDEIEDAVKKAKQEIAHKTTEAEVDATKAATVKKIEELKIKYEASSKDNSVFAFKLSDITGWPAAGDKNVLASSVKQPASKTKFVFEGDEIGYVVANWEANDDDGTINYTVDVAATDEPSKNFKSFEGKITGYISGVEGTKKAVAEEIQNTIPAFDSNKHNVDAYNKIVAEVQKVISKIKSLNSKTDIENTKVAGMKSIHALINSYDKTLGDDWRIINALTLDEVKGQLFEIIKTSPDDLKGSASQFIGPELNKVAETINNGVKATFTEWVTNDYGGIINWTVRVSKGSASKTFSGKIVGFKSEDQVIFEGVSIFNILKNTYNFLLTNHALPSDLDKPKDGTITGFNNPEIDGQFQFEVKKWEAHDDTGQLVIKLEIYKGDKLVTSLEQTLKKMYTTADKTRIEEDLNEYTKIDSDGEYTITDALLDLVNLKAGNGIKNPTNLEDWGNLGFLQHHTFVGHNEFYSRYYGSVTINKHNYDLRIEIQEWEAEGATNTYRYKINVILGGESREAIGTLQRTA